MEWLDNYPVDVINGAKVLDLEVSKARQYAKLKRAGIAVPPSIFATSTQAILDASTAIGFPLVLKPNRGGKGWACAVLTIGTRSLIRSIGFRMKRAAISGAQTVLSSSSNMSSPQTDALRELNSSAANISTQCPWTQAAASNSAPPKRASLIKACPVGTTTNNADTGFTILDRDPYPDLIESFESFLATNDIDIAGIEYLVDEQGRSWTYDVNTNTNYNSAAETNAGLEGTDRAGMRAVAAYLRERLVQQYPQTQSEARTAAA